MVRETLTVAEAAARLGISVKAAREAAKRGDLPAFKVGRRYLIVKARFDRLFSN